MCSGKQEAYVRCSNHARSTAHTFEQWLHQELRGGVGIRGEREVRQIHLRKKISVVTKNR